METSSMTERGHPLCEDCYADECPPKDERVVEEYRDLRYSIANYTTVIVVTECAGFLPYEGRQ